MIIYGDQDLMTMSSYSQDPTTGATLVGLAPDAVTVSSVSVGHLYPFDPEIDDFAGTDQIYTGSSQSGFADGYSSHTGRIMGPQLITLDYSSIVPVGHGIDTLTLGISADDFQFPTFGNPYSALLNGSPAAGLTDRLNVLNQTGPLVQFFSIGIDPSVLTVDHVLTLSIDQGGNGGDGWGIDFLAVGVTTSVVPDPSTAFLMGLGLVGLAAKRRAS
ncbi:MAG: PEP-CTERM sorting domain-containing protein [Myxococcota bacterium]